MHPDLFLVVLALGYEGDGDQLNFALGIGTVIPTGVACKSNILYVRCAQFRVLYQKYNEADLTRT